MTEAEQNRLIIENQGLVEPVAAEYRGRKGIPFEEIVAEGMVGLVLAARMWRKEARFATYAVHKIHSAILNFIQAWQHLVPIDEDGRGRDPEDSFFEWDVWPHAAPYESWVSLAATPEEIVGAFQEIAAKTAAFNNAMLSLNRRDREIVQARFLRNPPQRLESIALDHEISYARVVFLLDRALKKMREVVQAIETKRAA